ncbi:MAG: hypothetical protein HY717_08060 [Planctomycetes bacterium]|nr:hypothetical protein [Planctomycetota bacterium]
MSFLKSTSDKKVVFLLIALIACLVPLFLAGFTGCNTGHRNPEGTGLGSGGGPLPPNTSAFSQPILFNIEPETVCPGQVITLTGINFTSRLSGNRILFRGRASLIDATPLNVSFPIDNNPADGLSSRIQAVVPTGVVTGNIELEVNGIFAGAAGYIACPMILGFGLGQNGDANTLQHNGPLGFDRQQGAADIILYGLNFDELTEILLQDSQGSRASIAPGDFQRRTFTPDNGLDAISFYLKGVVLAVRSPRDNIRVQIKADPLQSNEVAVPVQAQNDNAPDKALGPVINGVLLPSGVRTGPVQIQYSFYDRPLAMSYQMAFEWTADNGQNWFPGQSRAGDPENNGVDQVAPGHFSFGSPAGVLRSGGTLRTFTWDAQKDKNFRTLNEKPGPNGSAAARNWRIYFRIRATPRFPAQPPLTKFDPGILFNTPYLAYFDLEDRPGQSVQELRRGEFFESFDTEALKDPGTTALWGPPFNKGSLDGKLSTRPISPLGDGTLDLVVAPVDAVPQDFLREFYAIDTSRMNIQHVLVVCSDPVTGGVCPGVELEQAIEVFPTPQFPNLGQNLGEFHLRTLVIQAGINIVADGTRPIIFRLSGRGLSEEELAFQHLGTIDLSGTPGGIGGAAAGAGGRGLLGAGNGGNGASLTSGPAGVFIAPQLPALTRAQPGGNGGGLGGETTGLVDPVVADPTKSSRVTAAPGGGGGFRLPGGDGDPGQPTPTVFDPPRGGRGGPSRGNDRLVPLFSGSGGGGGGSSLSVTGGNVAVSQGGGGGGSGGAIQIAAHGSMDIIQGRILANGGNGGDGATNGGGTATSAPGGGGSGGAILLQATGFILVNCDNLQVNGGKAGTARSMNTKPGSGDGSPGRIRVETGLGGGPFCGTLAARSRLAEQLSNSTAANTRIKLSPGDAAKFPSQGIVYIDDNDDGVVEEIISYAARPAGTDTLESLTRKDPKTHQVNSAVILETNFFPPRSFAGGQLQPAVDLSSSTGTGQDGVLNLYFIASLDPETGEVIRDASGNQISIWTFNTDTGILRDPRGAKVKVVVSAQERPNLLDLTILRIDEGVVLRGVGSRPLEIEVLESADIRGAIEVSGFEGEPIVFDPDRPFDPLPGKGGDGGPGGGEGGDGGRAIFLADPDGNDTDAKFDNRVLQNIEAVDGQPGHLPPEIQRFMDELEKNGADEQLAILRGIDAPLGGLARRDPSCENVNGNNECRDTAPGGGGGGYLEDGKPAEMKTGLLSAPVPNSQGEQMATLSLRYNGGYFPFGGQGGSGGGPSAAVSDAYVKRQAGPGLFRGEAKHAPGTGGGGGGGALRLAVHGALHLYSTSRLSANGGHSFQSIDLAGNGGAGAGGLILIQVENSLAIERGTRLEAIGGRANLPVPLAPQQTIPLYEGNLRRDGTGVTQVFGGRGGDGSPGRMVIEAPNSVNLFQNSINENVFSGLAILNVERAVAISSPFRFGVGPGGALFSHNLDILAPITIFNTLGQPEGTEAFTLWEGAPESTRRYGEVGNFIGMVPSPEQLIDADYVRFTVYLFSNNLTREVPSIREIRVPYELKK